jgi:hypothetical protein
VAGEPFPTPQRYNPAQPGQGLQASEGHFGDVTPEGLKRPKGRNARKAKGTNGLLIFLYRVLTYWVAANGLAQLFLMVEGRCFPKEIALSILVK